MNKYNRNKSNDNDDGNDRNCDNSNNSVGSHNSSSSNSRVAILMAIVTVVLVLLVTRSIATVLLITEKLKGRRRKERVVSSVRSNMKYNCSGCYNCTKEKEQQQIFDI